MKNILISSLCLAAIFSQASAQTECGSCAWVDAVVKSKAELREQLGSSVLASKTVKSGEKAQKFSVDLKGVDQFSLITLAGADGFAGDEAVFVNGYFITNDGKKVTLEDERTAYAAATVGGIKKNVNLDGSTITIAGTKYNNGTTCHANGIMSFNLRGRYASFEALVGIDDSEKAGTVCFKAVNFSPRDKVNSLRNEFPSQVLVLSEMLPYQDVWMAEAEAITEKNAVEAVIAKLPVKGYYTAKVSAIEAEADVDAKIACYLKLLAELQDVVSLQKDLCLINLEATEKAYNDMKRLDGFDAAATGALLTELKALVAGGFDGIYEQDQVALDAASKALALKKQIVFANPLLDADRIVMAKYNLGGKARAAYAPQLGTQNNNWSNQESAARGGFDAEIIEISNLRGDIETRTVFKAPHTSSIADLKMHWDADRVMFTAVDETKKLNVWEVKLDGTGYRNLMPSPEDDIEFYDGTYLPDGRVIAVSNIGYQGVPCVNGSDPVGNMVLYNPKDESYRRLTFDQDANWHPTVMNNGKIMYTRWEYTDLMHYYSRFVMSMNPDGTEQKALYGSGSAFPNSMFDLQPLPGHSTAFVATVSGHHGVARAGRTLLFDPTKSRKGDEGIMYEILHSDGDIDTKARDRLVDGVWPQFIKPMPLDDTYFLVAAKLSATDLWGIYLVDIFDNMTCIMKQEGEGFISPILVTKKVTPPSVPDRVKLGEKEGTVFIQDIYEGEGLRGVPRGTVKELRLHTYEYAYLHTTSDHHWHGIQSGWDLKRRLGTVPVEEDGSAIFKVPANTPISIQPLDENGATIQWMRSWLTAQPGEVVSCVGCHEDQNEIPVPKRVIASQIQPHEISVPEGGTRSFTYNLEVQPVLDRACIACHDGEGAFDLTNQGEVTVSNRRYGKSYLNLHPYVHRQGAEADMTVLQPYEYHANTSELIRILKNGHHNVELTDAEWRVLYNWIDYNAPYLGQFDDNPHTPVYSTTEYSQYNRRIELTEKYGLVKGADWRAEIESYAELLDSKGPIEATMPEPLPAVKEKNVKAKGWPFDAATAKQMQEATGESTMEIEVGDGVKIKFVRIPAGEFAMGSYRGVANNAPMSKVKIDKPFWMAEVEITNEQFGVLCPEHDSRYVDQLWKDHVHDGYPANLPEQPVIRVSYLQAVEYCQMLSEKTGMNVTLPTEAQWEWACRAGSDSDFWFGNLNSDFGKMENLADKTTLLMAVAGVDPKPMATNNSFYKYFSFLPKDESVDDGAMNQVDSKNYLPNPFGLYSMHGNIAEWTRSDFVSYPYTTKSKETSEYKVVRGGSYIERAKFATAYNRKAFYPHQRVFNVGFRVIIEE
ncbi:MAG: SUMF1/EgtB/PvdO family nonheme iron enzyme [Rikenellaceae bacterium]